MAATDAREQPADQLERARRAQLDILRVASIVCAELDLAWFVDGRTCLGAVTCGGFLAGEQAAEIALPLEDYRSLCTLAPHVLPQGYALRVPGADGSYPHLFAQLCRVEGAAGTGGADAPASGAAVGTAVGAPDGATDGAGTSANAAGTPADIPATVNVHAYAQLDSDAGVAARQLREAARWRRAAQTFHGAGAGRFPRTTLKSMHDALQAAKHGLVRRRHTPASLYAGFEGAFASGDGKGPWVSLTCPERATLRTGELFPTGTAPFEGVTVAVPHDAQAYLSALYGDYSAAAR